MRETGEAPHGKTDRATSCATTLEGATCKVTAGEGADGRRVRPRLVAISAY